MNKLDIFCFTSVARTKNFSITARELRISQQAVSKHIKNIEDELGYQLFFRNLGLIELTKAGEYMLAYFSRRSDLIDEIRGRFIAPQEAPSVTIACSQWIGCPSRVLDAARGFHGKNPGVAVHLLDLDAGETIQAVSAGTIDLLVTTRYTARQLPVLWQMDPLSSQPLYLIHRSSTPCPDDRRHLFPFFAPSAGESRENAIHMRVKHTCKALGFTPQNICVFPDMGSVMLNILLQNGITISGGSPNVWQTPDFRYEPLPLSADIVLCHPAQMHNKEAQKICSVLIQECNAGIQKAGRHRS